MYQLLYNLLLDKTIEQRIKILNAIYKMGQPSPLPHWARLGHPAAN